MRYDLSYAGKKLKLKLSGDDLSPHELRRVLDSAHRMEQSLSEADLRAKVVRQLKKEILQDDHLEEAFAPGWWDIPQDLLKGKESGRFITMEADLNPALLYEKTSFSLKTVITDRGKQLVLDREQLRRALQRLSINDRLAATNAVLVRVKGVAAKDVRAELEDYLRKHVQVDRFAFLYDHKEYGDRASLELVLFGDFPVE
ncbi:hypothetical protein JXA12_03450 [Candidatus Woesearchaeota archaeon]|nr:hypothetical protein [Candidatus Woesearchaeota archaeon]